MEISNISQTYVGIIPAQSAVTTCAEEILPEEAQITEDSIELETDSNIPVEEEIQNPADNDIRQKGVIRLLQAGHFKGVADIRLRINFHEEIAALEQAEKSRTAKEGISGLIETINTEIETFLQSEEIDEETAAIIADASEILNSGISEVAENSAANYYTSTDNLISSLQTKYDDFASTVNACIAAPPEEGDVETDDISSVPENETASTVDEDISNLEEEQLPAEDSISPLELFLAGLTELFTARLDELEMLLLEIRVLPEISQPSGNGRAYEKFVDIYNSLTEKITNDIQSSLTDVTA